MNRKNSIFTIVIVTILSMLLFTIIAIYLIKQHPVPSPEPIPSPEPSPTPPSQECMNEFDMCNNSKGLCLLDTFPNTKESPPLLRCERPSIRYDIKITGLSTDIYSPINNNQPRAYILFIHGGGLVKGSSKSTRETAMALELALGGYEVYIPNYSIGAGSFPKNVGEITDFIKYLSEEVKSKIYLMSVSAGSLVLLNAIAREPSLSDRVEGMIIFYGVINPLDRTFVEDTERHQEGDFKSGHLVEVLGTRLCLSCKNPPEGVEYVRDYPPCVDTFERKVKLHCTAKPWIDAVPYTWFKPDMPIPRTLLLHGRLDKIVEQKQSKDLYNVLTHMGRKAEFIDVVQGKHGFGFHKNKDGTPLEQNLYQAVVNFIRDTSSPPPTPQPPPLPSV